MQLQGLLFMLFMMVLIPIMIITTSHNVFFIALALVLFIASVHRIYALVFNIGSEAYEEDKDSEEDLQDLLNLDMKKFGTGVKVAKNLCIILFLIYCSLYMHLLWIEILMAFLLAYWIFDIRTHLVSQRARPRTLREEKLAKLTDLFVNISTIVIIIVVAFDKFFKHI